MESKFKNSIINSRNSGKTYEQISEELNCSKSLISFYCKKEGLGGNKKISQVEIDEYQRLFDNGKSIKYISEKYGRTRKTISLYINKENRKKIIKDTSYFKRRRNKIKRILIDYKGGKCSNCGYNKCMAALDFHHSEPSLKEFNICRAYIKSLKRAKEEVDKCIILCSNCHRELHHPD